MSSAEPQAPSRASREPRRAKGSGPAQRQWQDAVSEARARPSRRDRGPTRPERPPPPWHPVPLSEILILLGALGFVIGLRRGPNSGGRAPLLLGIIVVSLGTIEVCLREHRSGFRSHTILLALLPVVIVHTAAVLIITAFTPVTAALNLALVVVDVGLFALLFRVLRMQYGRARHRTLTGARRTRP